jgi:hypothetical protein
MKIKGKYYIRYRLVGILITLAILLLLSGHNISAIDKTFSEMASKLNRGKNCALFSTEEKLSIYGLNLYMGIFGYPLYPNASKETLLMIFKCESGEREYFSDFPYHSKKVKEKIQTIINSVKNSKRSEEKYSTQVIWGPEDYNVGSNEAEYALALNAMDIEINARKIEKNWNIGIITKTRISYAVYSEATLIDTKAVKSNSLFVKIFGDFKLSVNEGLFKTLEECGWLYPYFVSYKFSIKH